MNIIRIFVKEYLDERECFEVKIGSESTQSLLIAENPFFSSSLSLLFLKPVIRYKSRSSFKSLPGSKSARSQPTVF